METDKDERESLKFRGYTCACPPAGFTFVELMVVIAIMSVMAGAVTVGWHSFADFIAVRNAAGNMEDILSELEREVIAEDVKKTSVRFEDSYLLADSKKVAAKLSLEWEKVLVADDDCTIGDIKFRSPVTAQFFAYDAEGNPLFDSVPLQADEEFCVNPLEYKKRELVYELQTDKDFSNSARIFPLNLGLSGSNDIYLEDNDYRLEISRPYGQKRRFNGAALLDEDTEAVITIRSKEGTESAAFSLPKK